MPAADRGVFVQGVFRGNLGIIGLAFIGGVYGDNSNTFAAAAIFTGALALIAAIAVKTVALPLPNTVLHFAAYLKNLTLPLALLTTGASFDLRGIFGAGRMALWASAGRLVASPLVFVAAGILFGLHGAALGLLYLMGATPAAAASYIMAKAMGGNATAAANIIAITTACSLLLVAPVIALFPWLGWA